MAKAQLLSRKRAYPTDDKEAFSDDKMNGIARSPKKLKSSTNMKRPSTSLSETGEKKGKDGEVYWEVWPLMRCPQFMK
jgi:hypothetical protein